ncbi:cGMP-dependent protein kinase 2-like [Acropora muricata]|uniref:cGMP-dependent protein kinase 2-like n=1 Tax=Acropora muricata TaxID=159855 RepID=UPI0034E45FE4
MGNKQGRGGGGSQTLSPSSETLANPSLTSDAINTLTNCLKELPIVLDQRVTDEVVRRVELVQIEDTARTLLKKDHNPPGIYVLLSGNVDVVSEGQKFVLRRIKEGDCFGEVSVLFNIKCTADVKTVDRCDLLLLNLDDARQLLILSEEVTLLQWFQRRRYFDTGKLFADLKLSREVAKDVLQKSPLFFNWRMEPLEAVVNTVKPDAVVLYQDQSLIFKEGWKGQEMFILVYGQVAMFTGDQELAMFDAGHRGFTFGEEGFFIGTERRSTVRSVGPCQIITLQEENFCDAVNQFPIEARLLQELTVKWKEHVSQRHGELYSKYGGALDLEILRMALKQTAEFQICPPGFLYIVALSMTIREADVGRAVLSKHQYQDGASLFVVLQGSAVVVEEGGTETPHTYKLREVFWKNDNMPHRGWVKATQLCVVAVFPEGAVREAKNTFPDVVLPRP